MERIAIMVTVVIVAGLGSLAIQFQSARASSHIPGNPRFYRPRASAERYQQELEKERRLATYQYTLDPGRHFTYGFMGPQTEDQKLYHSQSFVLDTCLKDILVNLNVCQCAPYGSISGGRLTLTRGSETWITDFYHLGGEGTIFMEETLPPWAKPLAVSIDRETISDEFLEILDHCYQAKRLKSDAFLEDQGRELAKKLLGTITVLEAENLADNGQTTSH